MSDFIILTDSSADLSGEMAQAADVQVLPLTSPSAGPITTTTLTTGRWTPISSTSASVPARWLPPPQST